MPHDDRESGDLADRIRAAKARQTGSASGGRHAAVNYSGLGLGVRIATEMVASIGVGVGIGLVLDRWLGTQPLFLIVFFLLGTAAAFMGVIRQARAHDAAHSEGRGASAPRTGDTAGGAAGGSRDEED